MDRTRVACKPRKLKSFTWNDNKNQCVFQVSKKQSTPCITYRNGQIQISGKHFCGNCCMKLLIETKSLQSMYYKNDEHQSEEYLQALCSLTMHPQILCHFTKNKSLHKLALTILINASWFSGTQIDAIYWLTTKEAAVSRTWLRLSLCHFMEFCQTKKHLLSFIKLNHGKYFNHCIVGYLEQIPRFFDMMREIETLHSDKFEAWAAMNRWPFLSYHIAVKIVFKYGKYFRKKLRKKKGKILKQCYKYLAKLFVVLPKLQRSHKEWVEFAFGDKAIQIYTKKDAYNGMMYIHRNKIHCNNPVCNVKYGNYMYPTSPSFDRFEPIFEFPKPQKKWYKCKKCKIAYYCSKKCQKYDWNRFNHKYLCRHFCNAKKTVILLSSE